MSRLHIETPEQFHGQPSAAPDLRGLAARHVEPERVVDWQRKATDLSQLLAAALDEIDRLRLRAEKAEGERDEWKANWTAARKHDHERYQASAAAAKPRTSRDCRTCRHESGDGLNECSAPAFTIDIADWIREVEAAGLFDRDQAVTADTPTDCPGWQGMETL